MSKEIQQREELVEGELRRDKEEPESVEVRIDKETADLIKKHNIDVVETIKDHIRTQKDKAQLLGYHIAKCPYCKKEIAVPQYRNQPITLEEYKKYSRTLIAETI